MKVVKIEPHQKQATAAATETEVDSTAETMEEAAEEDLQDALMKIRAMNGVTPTTDGVVVATSSNGKYEHVKLFKWSIVGTPIHIRKTLSWIHGQT